MYEKIYKEFCISKGKINEKLLNLNPKIIKNEVKHENLNQI